MTPISKWLFSVAATLTLFCTVLSAGRAQTNFYFANPGSSAPITTTTVPGTGKTFTVSVYYQSSTAANGVDVFVGYDNATTEGSSAMPTAGKITLSGDANTSISNMNTTNFSNYFGGQLGGGQSTAAGARPYGDDLFFGTTGGTTYLATAPTHLFDITFVNSALAAGSSYALSLYNGGTGSDFTTYVTPDGSTFVRPATAFLTVTAAPEPSQTAALGLGTLCLCGLLLRARKRALPA